MKHSLLYELNGIDPALIDEHLAWNSREKASRQMRYRAASIAACLVLIGAFATALVTGGIRREAQPDANPPDTVPNTSQRADIDTPPVEPSMVIYADNFDLGIGGIGSEVYIPIRNGTVIYMDGLYDIVNSDEPYGDNVFAVGVYFSMGLAGTDERYLTPSDETEAAEGRGATVREYGNSLLTAAGLNYRFVTICWTDGGDSTEPVSVETLRILHLTKEQLRSFRVPSDIGAQFVLLPKWVDCGKDTVYRDFSLLPIQCE